jgi:hypothetical protein
MEIIMLSHAITTVTSSIPNYCYSFFKPAAKQQATKQDYKTEIIRNLTCLKSRYAWLDSCLDDSFLNELEIAIEKSSDDAYWPYILSCLTALSREGDACIDKIKSDYPNVKNMVEALNVVSNLGFFVGGYNRNDFVTLYAGICSLLYHAFPVKPLNILDRSGALAAVLKAIYNFDLFLKYPSLLISGAFALVFGGMDKIQKNYYQEQMDRFGPIFHVLWHISAALFMHKLNQTIDEAPGQERSSVVEYCRASLRPV